jgi:uncharacterized spore protein YtfJ
MPKAVNPAPAAIEQTEQQEKQFVDRIFGAARASAVFSEPVAAGAYTVITASEVTAGGGFGGGHGYGPAATTSTTAEANSAQPAVGGGGSGGGGGSSGRPVAVIVVGPDGVQVKPIFDVTKIGLAVLTAWAAMLVTVLRMRQTKRGY